MKASVKQNYGKVNILPHLLTAIILTKIMVKKILWSSNIVTCFFSSPLKYKNYHLCVSSAFLVPANLWAIVTEKQPIFSESQSLIN